MSAPQAPQALVRRVDERSVDVVCDLWAQQREERAPTELGLRRVTADVVRAALLRPETVAFAAYLNGAAVGDVYKIQRVTSSSWWPVPRPESPARRT